MRARTDRITVITPGEVGYTRAREWQRQLVAERIAGGPDTTLLLTHPPVYTAGRRTQPTDRPTDGTPVVDVDRGGRITWHGPGQLVGYPIVGLAAPVDLVRYVRLLEEVLIAVCDDLGLSGTGRISGRSGVWLRASGGRPERKVAAIGVRVAKGVTEHGFALNCDADLSAFDRIVPCGITDAGVSSLSMELGRTVTVSEALPVVERRLLEGLSGQLLISDHTLPSLPAQSGPARILIDSR